jgi:hypothetical protein
MKQSPQGTWGFIEPIEAWEQQNCIVRYMSHWCEQSAAMQNHNSTPKLASAMNMSSPTGKMMITCCHTGMRLKHAHECI